MTRVRRVRFEFEDIKAITIECNKFHTKTEFSADVKAEIPFNCGHCGNSWRSPEARSGAWTNGSAMVSFVQSIPTMRTFLK